MFVLRVGLIPLGLLFKDVLIYRVYTFSYLAKMHR